MSYSDKLDPEQQIDTEEKIAGLIFLHPGAPPDFCWPSEEDCMDMGRRILSLVLKEFCPELIADDRWSWNENSDHD